MAARKKKTVKKTKAKKAPAKKSKTRVAKAVAKKPTKKTKAKKTAPVKAKAAKRPAAKKAVKTAKKKTTSREYGEGNYKASKRFRESEETFIAKNRAKLPALGKAAEDALDGPEGDELRAAEAATAKRAAGQPEE